MSDERERRIAENPFSVLGLPTSADRQAVEREGAKLLSMLELNLAEAQRYASPLGERVRTPELVRHAMAELRDPAKRLMHEAFALAAHDVTEPAQTIARWAEAPAVFGFGATEAKDG